MLNYFILCKQNIEEAQKKTSSSFLHKDQGKLQLLLE